MATQHSSDCCPSEQIDKPQKITAGCDHNHSHEDGEKDFRGDWIALSLAIILFLVGLTFNAELRNTPGAIAEYAVLIPAYLICGWPVLVNAGRNIIHGQIFDENFLMTIATLGAIAIHEIPEAVAVMLFFQIGERLQDFAVGKSRHSIKSLLALRPDKANLMVDGTIQVVKPESINRGETILVKPGEKVPLDGEILSGSSQIVTAALTGESIPRTVTKGETILAGSINQTGSLTLRVSKSFSESSIAKIFDLVENATNQKAPTEKLFTRFAQIYTPIVVFLSIAVALLPPLFITGATHPEWLYRALILLVISCPCGLIISIPLGYFGGIGGAAKQGILVKGSAYLDTLNTVSTVVFDKTGTLTAGVFQVVDIMPKNGLSQPQFLEMAAIAESQSNHPIARSIVETYAGEITVSDIQNYEELSGQGIRALIQNKEILVGNEKLLQAANIQPEHCDRSGTVVHLAIDGVYAGYLVIADRIKPDAISVIAELKGLGISKTVMLTGDNRLTAEAVAHQLGLEEHQSELLPEEKVKAIEQYLKLNDKKYKVAYVGDGINDAPVIARADVGIAMGALGSDAAIETADVVLMADKLTKVAEAIKISRRTHHIVWQNIILAMVIKILFILFGAIGLATLWEAVFADVGVALLAILNASRVLR